MFNIHRLVTSKSRSWQIALVVFVVFIAVMAITAYFANVSKLRIHQTSYTLDDTVQLTNNVLRGYSGANFYKLNPNSNTPVEVLYSPSERLPAISSLLWANDNGVLLTFESGVNRTSLEPLLEQRSISRFNDNLHTWYLDFNAGELKHVVDTELSNAAAAYSEAENSFYFARENQGGATTISRYSIADDKKTDVTTISSVGEVTSVQRCSTNICLVAKSPATVTRETKLMELTKNGTVRQIDSGGVITPVGDGVHFLTYKDSLTTPGDVIDTYGRLSILNTSTRKTVTHTGVYALEGIAIGAHYDTVYRMGLEEAAYTSFDGTKTKTAEFEPSNGTTINGIIGLPEANTTNTTTLLIGSFTRALQLITSERSVNDRLSLNEDVSAIKTCVEKNDSHLDGPFEGLHYIYVLDDTQFSSRIKQINQCITRSPDSVIGISLQYFGVNSDGTKTTN